MRHRAFYENNGFVTHAEPQWLLLHREYGRARVRPCAQAYHSPPDTPRCLRARARAETSKEMPGSIRTISPESRRVLTPHSLTCCRRHSSTDCRASGHESDRKPSVSWIDTATNANGYRVERSLDGYTFTQIAQLGSSAAEARLIAAARGYGAPLPGERRLQWCRNFRLLEPS